MLYCRTATLGSYTLEKWHFFAGSASAPKATLSNASATVPTVPTASRCMPYDRIRDRYASLLTFSVPKFAQQCMRSVFDISQQLQRQLAHCVAAMDVYRRYLLGKVNLFEVCPELPPIGYVAVMPYSACLRRRASPSTIGSVGVLESR